MGAVPGICLPFCYHCHPVEIGPGSQSQEDAAPYLKHLLFQESFFVCTIKDFGGLPGGRDIYVETVVDANCRLGFTKVYPFKNSMNAADILLDRVLPFYERYAATIGRICTRSTSEYCSLAPIHPFETLLANSHIEHSSLNPSCGMHNQPCEEFYHVLREDFFTPAIRKNSYKSFSALQRDLDGFVEGYNHDRPYFVRSSQDPTPFGKFLHTIGLSEPAGHEPKASPGGL